MHSSEARVFLKVQMKCGDEDILGPWPKYLFVSSQPVFHGLGSRRLRRRNLLSFLKIDDDLRRSLAVRRKERETDSGDWIQVHRRVS